MDNTCIVCTARWEITMSRRVSWIAQNVKVSYKYVCYLLLCSFQILCGYLQHISLQVVARTQFLLSPPGWSYGLTHQVSRCRLYPRCEWAVTSKSMSDWDISLRRRQEEMQRSDHICSLEQGICSLYEHWRWPSTTSCPLIQIRPRTSCEINRL